MALVRARIFDLASASVKEFDGELKVDERFRDAQTGIFYGLSEDYAKGFCICDKGTFEDFSSDMAKSQGGG
jgi:hypothetical protein